MEQILAFLAPVGIDRPTSEELSAHAKQDEYFEAVEKLKLFRARILSARTDGWIPSDQWETSQKDHMKLFDLWLKSTRKPGESDDRGRKKLWPFNETGL